MCCLRAPTVTNLVRNEHGVRALEGWRRMRTDRSHSVAECETEHLGGWIARAVWRRHADVIPAVRAIALLFNLFPGHTNVNAIFTTSGFPKAIAKANFCRIAILAVTARYFGPVGHHPRRIEFLVNGHIGSRMIVILSPRLGKLEKGSDHQDDDGQCKTCKCKAANLESTIQ